jgi:hypothetical protein
MEKLIFFGDSFTYGEGLSDCSLPGAKQILPPSKLGWANLLCEIRNASGRNLSKPGASNLQILWTMLHTKIEPDEIIIVQWSFWNRDCLLHDNKIALVGPWDESSRPYYELHSNSDMINRNWLNINHGHLWLKQQPNHFFMFANEKYHANLFKYFDNNLSEANKYRMRLTDQICTNYFNDFDPPWLDMAEDNEHPGPKTNLRWANVVNQLLDSKIK